LLDGKTARDTQNQYTKSKKTEKETEKVEHVHSAHAAKKPSIREKLSPGSNDFLYTGHFT
jgi:hypothetical protein